MHLYWRLLDLWLLIEYRWKFSLSKQKTSKTSLSNTVYDAKFWFYNEISRLRGIKFAIFAHGRQADVLAYVNFDFIANQVFVCSLRILPNVCVVHNREPLTEYSCVAFTERISKQNGTKIHMFKYSWAFKLLIDFCRHGLIKSGKVENNLSQLRQYSVS